MAVIKIQSFGGEAPSVSSRSLPAGAARTSKNLLARTPEFRPLAADTAKATSAVSNPKTLYRLARTSTGAFSTDMTAGWITDAAEVNYVKGQIDDDLTERTYYTLGDGSAPPKALDATMTSSAQHRLLGVPPPAKPAVVLNESGEYTVEEDTAARTAVPLAISAAVTAARTAAALGNAPTGAPAAGVAGWLAHGTTTTPALPTTALGDWAYLAPMVVSGSGYVMQFPAASDFLMATEFAGIRVAYGGNQFWAVPVKMQGAGYAVNSSTLTSSLTALQSPDGSATPLLTNAVVTSSVNAVVTAYAATTAPQKSQIDALNAAQAALGTAFATTANQTVLADTIKAFYAKTDVAAEITLAISNFAASVSTGEASALSSTNTAGM